MLSPLEVFGLTPFSDTLAALRLVVGGSPHIPKTRFGRSSLGILRPALGVRTWLGRRRADGRVQVSNLFNRTQTPLAAGWSVERTQVRDFRGRGLTYDSHNGTDFAVPIGTTVVAPAPGRVALMTSVFNRGGLKGLLDPGGGLFTMSAHLGRALAPVGRVLRRGEPFALSAYSGLDAVVAFPWSPPHVHFNTWLDGEPVDPFAAPGETALWRGGNDPTPCPDEGVGETEPVPAPSAWDAAGLAAAARACQAPELAARIAGAATLEARGAMTLFLMNYYPTTFAERPTILAGRHARAPRLDLPFLARDARGVVFADEA
jgi:murein DD-endopeptidase